jgi:hypothetical protein
MVIDTRPFTSCVHSLRSLLAFVHEANGWRVGKPASIAAISPRAGRRLHARRDQEPNPSHGNAGATARADADRVTAKGEL